MKPFIADEVFEINDNHGRPQIFDDSLIVDNFYKNYDQIQSVLSNMPVENWKKKANSRNFIDYYDCRPYIKNWQFGKPTEQVMLFNDIVRHWIVKYLDNNVKLTRDYQSFKEFNVFKHIKLPPQTHQLGPHTDNGWTVLIYLDDVADGGTALYEQPKRHVEDEGINLLQDVSDLSIIDVIPAAPNRLAIFPGHRIWHGAYIDDHTKYLNDWRINQVMFIPEES